MNALANTSPSLLLNTSGSALSQLRFRNFNALVGFAAANAGVAIVERDPSRRNKRANFELLARNVVASSTTAHQVTERLYAMRPMSFGPYSNGAAETQIELQLLATITWQFTAGSGGEIPIAQMPSDAAAFQRFSPPSDASVASSLLTNNEVSAEVRATGSVAIQTGAMVHVQDGGATVGYVRHFTSMNNTLIEGVLPFSQLFDE